MLLVRKLVSELSPSTKIILMSATMQGPLFVNYFAEVFDFERVSSPLFVGIKRCRVEEYFVDELSQLVETTPVKDNNLERDKSGNYVSKMSRQYNSHMMTCKGSTMLQPIITCYMQDLCNEIILFCYKRGECILVFLPGINEIMDCHESLSSLLHKRGLEDVIQLFILHSQVPIEEQQAILQPPPLDVSHVILSTNIAESSLTIPMLRVVINFGLCKVPQYDHKRKMTCLLRSWCSKSATVQRSGRVGRVFEGVAIHLFPKSFYHHSFTDFNPPEMYTTPLGKLLLKARQLGEEMGIIRPSELLKLTIEPPSLFQIEYALQELVFVGALLTDPSFTLSETADVTILGKFSLALPFDLDLCRLVFYGLFFGAPVEAIVMATSISLGQDLFSMPSRFLISSDKLYKEALNESMGSRVFYDNGKMSDAFQICFLFREWFQFFRSSDKKTSKTVSQFCNANSLNYRRFYLFLSVLSSTADQILPFIPQSSPCHRQVHILSLLTRSDCDSIDELIFCKDDSVIHTLLVACFVDNLLFGVQKMSSDVPNEMKLARLARDLISYSGFNPRGSLAMFCARKIPESSLHCMASAILPKGKIRTASSSGVGVVEIITPPTHLTKSQALLYLWQFCERRLHWKIEESNVTFTLPFSPYEIIWSRLFDRKEKVYVSIWRNTTGFVTDFTEAPPPILGVVTCLQGGESTQSRGRGLTVLPSLRDTNLSLLFILAFQPFSSSIELRTDTNSVTAFRINSAELDFNKWQTLSSRDLRNINSLRTELTQVLQTTELIGNCFSPLLMDSVRIKLIQLIKRGTCSNNDDYTCTNKLLPNCDIVRVQEFYPQLKCSLLKKESLDYNQSLDGNNKERDDKKNSSVTQDNTLQQNVSRRSITPTREKRERYSTTGERRATGEIEDKEERKQSTLNRTKASSSKVTKKDNTVHNTREGRAANRCVITGQDLGGEKREEEVTHFESKRSEKEERKDHSKERYHSDDDRVNHSKEEESNLACVNNNDKDTFNSETVIEEEVNSLHELVKDNEGMEERNGDHHESKGTYKKDSECVNGEVQVEKSNLNEVIVDEEKREIRTENKEKESEDLHKENEKAQNDTHISSDGSPLLSSPSPYCVSGSLNPLATSFVPIALDPSYRPRLPIPPTTGSLASGDGILPSPPGFPSLPSGLPPRFPSLLSGLPPGFPSLSSRLPPGFPSLPPGFQSHLFRQQPSNMPHPPTNQLPHPPINQLPHPTTNQLPCPPINQLSPLPVTTPTRLQLPPGFSWSNIPSNAYTLSNVCHILETIIIEIITKRDQQKILYSQLLKEKMIKEFLLYLNLTLPIDFFSMRPKLFKVVTCYDISTSNRDMTDYMISFIDQ